MDRQLPAAGKGILGEVSTFSRDEKEYKMFTEDVDHTRTIKGSHLGNS